MAGNCYRQTLDTLMTRFPDALLALAVRTMCALTAVAFALSVLAFPLVKGWASEPIATVQGYLVVAAGLLVLAVWRYQKERVERFGTWLASQQHFGLKILAIAFGLRLAGIFFLQWEATGDYALHELRVWQVSQGEGYLTPGKGPDPHWPPGYVLLMSSLYWLFGRSPLLLKGANALVDAASVILVWRFALAFWKDEATARLGAVVYAINPVLIAVSQIFIYGPLFGFFLLLLALCVHRSALLWGFLLGIGALIKPVILPAPLFLAVTSWMEGRPVPRIAGRVLMAAAVMLLVISPWTYRNYIAFDRFLLVSANGGWVLWWGNNPEAMGTMPNWTEEQRTVNGAELVDLDARLGREAVAYIRSEPGRFLAMIPVKLAHTFGTEAASLPPEIRYPALMPEALFRMIVQGFYIVLALGFAIAVWRWRARCASSIEGFTAITFVFLFAAIHATFIGWSFYHVPLLGFMSAFLPGVWRYPDRTPGAETGD